MTTRVRPSRLRPGRRSTVAVAVALAVALGAAGAVPAAAQEATDTGAAFDATADAGAAMTDQLIVRLAMRSSGAAASDVDVLNDAAAASLGGSALTYGRAMTGGTHVLRLSSRLPLEQVDAIAAELVASGVAASAEPDRVLQATSTPNDPLFPIQWSLGSPTVGSVKGANVPNAWDITQGDPNLVVAVLDTGQLNHADLAGKFVPGYDMISSTPVANDGGGRDANPADPGDWITSGEAAGGFFGGCRVTNSSWHGTHVAGTIGARTNNGAGIAGVNPESKIQHVRVLGKCGGFTSDIADAIRWAAGLPVAGAPINPTPARVINMSLGGSGSCSSVMQSAITAATAAGTIVVVAAGNSNANASLFNPANCANVITVASTGKAGKKAYYSNFGSIVDIAAPGGDTIADAGDTILSTLNTGTTSPGADAFVKYQGTSMATPAVAGVVSLMLSVKPTLTFNQVLSTLKSTATKFPALGAGSCTSTTCGKGIVNAAFAVATAKGLPAAFNKTAPKNGAVNVALRPTLKWQAAARTVSFEYCIDTTNNDTCNTSWVNVGTAKSKQLPANLAPNTTYFWQVRAINVQGTMPANNGVWFSFRTT